MDFAENPTLIVGIVLFLLLWVFFMRRRKPETTQRAIAESLLSEVRLNQAMLEFCRVREKPKKFSASNWRINKARLDFLAQSLQVLLSDVYSMAEDFNRQMDVAKRSKTASHIAYLDMEKLKEPLVKSREGLEDWLTANGGLSSGPSIRYPSIFDTLIGSGR